MTLLPGPLWSGLILPVRIPFIGQIHKLKKIIRIRQDSVLKKTTLKKQQQKT